MERIVRLQKFIADCGLASRRKAEEWIADGKVKVNGRVAQIGMKVDPDRDTVVVGGKKLKPTKQPVYLMMYKPRGVVTTLDDERDRRCVADLLTDVPQRVYPIGRLDRDSEGLLLLTNDGQFANAVLHPSGHIAKTYRVSVRPVVTEEQLTKLTASFMLDGYRTMPADVHIVSKETDRCVLQIVLYEGRNRQIRKMCEETGLTVLRLKRISVGQLTLGRLGVGEYRALKPDEVALIKRETGRF